MNQDTANPDREVVLVGGGHSHVQVLRHFAMHNVAAARLTLIVDIPIAVYSGMVPGFVAGQYEAEELEIDVRPLAQRAGARVILCRAVGVDAENKNILLEERPPIPYDVASIDIGSTVAALDLPGVREHAYPTRPIGRFVQRIDHLVEHALAHQEGKSFRIVVVGAGAGGVELAFALDHRMRSVGVNPEIHLLQAADQILPGYPAGLRRRTETAAAERGIEIRTKVRVVAAGADFARLDDDSELPSDALIWVTGAVAHSFFQPSGLPTDKRGFVWTRPTLQVEGHDDLFAVGDCASLRKYPRTPKAGVYAVRQGPILIRNLEAFLEGRDLTRYRPQKDFLTLLNLGDGRALGSKWGLSAAGASVMRLKDWIDRRFMRLFQVLDSDGAVTPEFAKLTQMSATVSDDDTEPAMLPVLPMLCGGCASKLGQNILAQSLERLGAPPKDDAVVLGLDSPDDAAAYRLPGGTVVVSSVDAFRAFTDDPYVVGRVAAVNAMSDLWAKGARPLFALATVTVPAGETRERQEDLLLQVLAGIRRELDPAGVALVGGHTMTAAELQVGLTVQGDLPDGDLLPLGGLEAGQHLVLTKPLGSGVLFHADMHGRASGRWIESALASMLRPNAAAAEIARHAGAGGSTDVSGFGLAGHAAEMVRASGVGAILRTADLPALPGALGLLGRGERSTSHAENRRSHHGIKIDAAAKANPRFELLFDPQTSGGLLFGIAPGRVEETLRRLAEAGDTEAAVVGEVTPVASDGPTLRVL